MLENIITDYSAYLQDEKGMAEATQRSYLGAVSSFLAVCRAHPERLLLPTPWQWNHLDKRALEIYLRHLSEERGWRTVSIAQQASALRVFFAFLQRRGYLERNPARSLKPRPPPRDETPPEGEEADVRRLFESRGDTLRDARRLLLLELHYGAALRATDIHRIRALRVNKRTGLATPTLGDRTLQRPLSPAGLERARRYLALRREAVAGRRRAAFWVDERGAPRNPQQLSREVKRELERVGLPGRPSLLRQLAARHFRERGGDTRSLRRLLGAKRLGSLDRYAPPDYQQVLRQFRRSHPRQEGRQD